MKLNEHERPRPNLAGLLSPVQQAEMKLLLSGGWPPLRPLPVFKFETDAGRVSIDFDKTRGEWLCRKTSLPANKVQELRGGLTEIIKAFPGDQAVVFAECFAAGQQEQELDKDASRRLRAMLEWKENYENGARYSGLQNYLSESQRGEIEDILRLTLTARQLQFCSKNVAYVFDALSKAGGKLATLLEIAQRIKVGQAAEVPAKEETAVPDAERHVPIESLIPSTLERFQEEPVASVSPERAQSASAERIAHSSPPASKIVTPDILDGGLPSFAEDRREKVHHHPPVASFGPQVRTSKVEPTANRIENSSSRQHMLEISGFHLAAFAFVFLFAVVSLPIGLTVGRGPLGRWLWDAQKSISAVHVTSPPLANQGGETVSRTSIPPAPELEESHSESSSAPSLTDFDNTSGAAKPVDATLSKEKSTVKTPDSESIARVPSADSNSTPTIESKPSVSPEANLGRNVSAGSIARNAPAPVSPKPALSPKVPGPISGAPKNPAPRSVAPATRPAIHRSPPSAILVTAPPHGSKPFRVTFPEKPIAASSSFAMTSELSVLVPPQQGAATAHRPARLQAGELVSFVWPRYPRPGDRYGAAETVKVRTTIGQLGQVLDIKLVSGSVSLLPATISAIRQWRYKPTLLNRRAVQVQQDVTIEFRPPQYLSQVRTQHPSHN
jgi:periplasmic protein TonB